MVKEWLGTGMERETKYQRSQRKPGERGWVGYISDYRETPKWKILRERQGRGLMQQKKGLGSSMKQYSYLR